MMGGGDTVIAKGRELFEAGEYKLATEIVTKLVYAEPENAVGRQLLADAYEQIGYQHESPSIRNSFLAAALELRSGIPEGASPKTGGPDLIRALATAHFLDFLGIRLDTTKTGGAAWTINLITPDNDERFVVELSNGTLTNLQGYLAEDPDLTITIDRAKLEEAMTGETPLLDLIVSGDAVLEGDATILQSLAEMLVHFELGFEIMPGSGEAHLSPELDPFASEPLESFC